MNDATNSLDGEPAFLDLGERLRQRGLLDAALSVAQAGVARYPMLAEAHDLVGRVFADQGDDDGARSAWLAALECRPESLGALKGLAFLAFRRRDFVEAERRLEAAARVAPRDPAILGALDRVRVSRPAAGPEPVDLDDPASGVLLCDAEGLRLAGGLGAGREAAAEAAAAETASMMREADRAARLLDLGPWRHVLIEGDVVRAAVLPVAPIGGLVMQRPLAAPAGRLLASAARARDAARSWLEQHG